MQPIIQHLFQASSLEEVSRERLESFVEEYPSFGFGRYLLSQKLKKADSNRFQEETLRTNLYFSNPFWLQWLLENTVEESVAPTLLLREEPPATDEPAFRETSVPEESIRAEEPLREEEPIHDEEPPFILEEAAEAITPERAPVDESSAADLLMQSIQEAQDLRLSLQKINEDFSTVTTPDVHSPVETAPDVHSPVKENIAAALPVSPPAPEAAPPPIAAPIFEPFHTIDYFASQGIKLVLEENPSDSLGKQVKSFTEWLKVMRRLPQKDRQILPDRVAEQTVQNIAAHSIEGREVVTETMAEVLAKQGMPERARAVYEKLIFINPEKRAYFATKIEQLNIH